MQLSRTGTSQAGWEAAASDQPFRGQGVEEGPAAWSEAQPGSRGRAGRAPARRQPRAASLFWSEVAVALSLGPHLLLPHGLQEGQLLGLFLLVPGLVLEPGGRARVSGTPRPRASAAAPATPARPAQASPVLDDALNDEVGGEVVPAADLTEDAPSLGLLGVGGGEEAVLPWPERPTPDSAGSNPPLATPPQPPRPSGGRCHPPGAPKSTLAGGLRATHLVRVRAVPVSHDLRLPVTHQVHLRSKSGGRCRPHGPWPSEGPPGGRGAGSAEPSGEAAPPEPRPHLEVVQELRRDGVRGPDHHFGHVLVNRGSTGQPGPRQAARASGARPPVPATLTLQASTLRVRSCRFMMG